MPMLFDVNNKIPMVIRTIGHSFVSFYSSLLSADSILVFFFICMYQKFPIKQYIYRWIIPTTIKWNETNTNCVKYRAGKKAHENVSKWTNRSDEQVLNTFPFIFRTNQVNHTHRNRENLESVLSITNKRRCDVCDGKKIGKTATKDATNI